MRCKDQLFTYDMKTLFIFLFFLSQGGRTEFPEGYTSSKLALSERKIMCKSDVMGIRYLTY